MQISSRFTIAVHVLICIETFKDEQKVTSDFLASSVNVNPVVIRRILQQLKAAGIVKVARGTGWADYPAGFVPGGGVRGGWKAVPFPRKSQFPLSGGKEHPYGPGPEAGPDSESHGTGDAVHYHRGYFKRYGKSHGGGSHTSLAPVFQVLIKKFCCNY